MSNRFVIFIFNAIIALLCVAAILFYFLFPLCKMSISYTVNAETFQKLVDDYDIDATEILGEDDITVGISLSLDAKEVFGSLTQTDAEQILTPIVKKSTDGILDSLNALMDALLNTVLSHTAATVQAEIKSQLTDYLRLYKPDLTDEEAQQLFQEAGLTDEYLTDRTDSVIQVLTSDGATVDGVSDSAVLAARTVYDFMQQSGIEEFSALEFTAENENAIRSSVNSALSDVTDEYGGVNADDFAALLLLKILRSINGSEDGGNEQQEEIGISGATPLSSDGSSEDTSDVREELNEEILLFITNYVPEQVLSVLRILLIALAVLLLFSCLTWVYLLIKMVVKLFSRNPAIKLKLPIFLGWIPFLLFWIIPTVAVSILLNVLAPELQAVLSISFFSSGVVAFAAAMLLIVLWIPYRVFRNRLKEK